MTDYNNTKNCSFISISDTYFLLILTILIVLFWNFADNQYDLYDLIYLNLEKFIK